MSAAQQEAQGGLLEALLQQVLGQVQGLSAAVAGQGRALDALSAGLGAVQGRLGNLEALQGELGGKLDRQYGKLDDKLEALQDSVQAKFQTLEAQQGELRVELKAQQGELRVELKAQQGELGGKLEAVRAQALSTRAALGDVVVFSREERARRDEQARQQRVFIHVVHIVAGIGYLGEVKACFSLNRDTWNDVRLWSIVVNKKYKHEEKHSWGGKSTFEETRLIHACRTGGARVECASAAAAEGQGGRRGHRGEDGAAVGEREGAQGLGARADRGGRRRQPQGQVEPQSAARRQL